MSIIDSFRQPSKSILSAQREYARAYVRVSHERSAEKNISPETQRRRIEEYARQKGYEIKEWYTDLGKSAFKNEAARTEFRRIIEDAKGDPETSVILVYRYDRFSRSMAAPVQQEDLLRHGVRVESAEEGYYDPDSESGAIMMPLTWSLNRLFSIKLRNIVIPNMATNFEQRDPDTGWAYKNGGRAMWGYRTHRTTVGRSAKYTAIRKATWLLDDTVVAGQEVWRWARTMLIEWRLEQKLGYRMIADKLTQLGIPTPSGKPGWSASSVYSLIGERDKLLQYAGYGIWNRRNCQDPDGVVGRDPSEWVIVQGAHPAIITEEECEKLLEMIQQPDENRRALKPKSRFALSGGLIKCAHCGANYAGAKRHGGDYYACGAHLYRRGAGCGPSWYIPKDQLENLVFGKLLKHLSDAQDSLPQWIAEANAALATEWTQFERTAAERGQTIEHLETQLQNLINIASAGGDVPEMAEKIAKTSAALSRLRRLQNVERPEIVTLERIAANRAEILAASQSLDPDVRKAVLTDYVIELSVNAEARTVEGRLVDPRCPKRKPEPSTNSDDSGIQTDGRARTRYRNQKLGLRTGSVLCEVACLPNALGWPATSNSSSQDCVYIIQN